MRRRRPLLKSALIFVGLAGMLAPSPATPPTTHGDPYDLALEWSDAALSSPAWNTSPVIGGDTRNVQFRLAGDSDHAGVYMVLLARAWIGDDFFAPGAPGENAPEYAGLQRVQPGQVFGSGTHPSIFTWPEVQPVLWAIWWPPNPNPNAANRRALPILQVPTSSTAERVWTSDYNFWDGLTKNYWGDRLAWQGADLAPANWPTGSENEFNLSRMWDLAYASQAPNGLSASRFRNDPVLGEAAEDAGMHLDIQGLLFQGEVPPSDFPEDGDLQIPPGLNTNPASSQGGFGGWIPEIEPTPTLSYTLLQADSVNRLGHRCPPESKFLSVSVTQSQTPVSAGDKISVLFDGLAHDTVFVAEIGGNPANRVNVSVEGGNGPGEVLYEIPAGLATGTAFEVVGTADRDFLVSYPGHYIQ